MRIEELGNHGVFAYIPELEPMWGALCLLMGGEAQTLCAQIYGGEQMDRWKEKHPFLFETFQVMEGAPILCMMDFLLDMELEKLTLEEVREVILALPPGEFIWRQLELERIPGASQTVVQRALTDDQALDEVYGWVADRGMGFLPFSAFFRQSRRFITEFFALAEQLRTPALEEALALQEPGVEQLYQAISAHAPGGDWLALSQEFMGKTFHNRGPYDQFVFLTSYLIPVKACRYFHLAGERKRQMLFLTLRQVRRSREDTVKALRAMGDSTRYQILTILAGEGPMRGLDLAKKLSLAPSTVSHHMEQMKESGLITEEPVKNSKYYGVSKQAAKALLEEIARDLQIE